MAIGDIASHVDQVSPSLPTMPQIPFAEPSKDQPLVDLTQNIMQDAAGNVIDNVQDFLNNTPNT